MPRFTEESMREAAEAVARHGTKAAASRALGIPDSTLKDRYRAAEAAGLTKPPEEQADNSTESWRFTETDESAVFEGRIDSLDDAWEKSGLDRAVWEIERVLVNGWDVTMKGPDKLPIRAQNKQLKVTFRRKVAKVIADAADELMTRFRDAAPVIPKLSYKPIRDPVLYEISPFDAHFGKLCWSEETGTGYDLKTADRLYRDAIDGLLGRACGYNIERILFPIGQDFFHFENYEAVTPKSGNRLDVDSRLPKVLAAGCRAVFNAIERCLSVAPVHLIHTAGNHDPVTSYMLALWVEARFHHTPHVTVDRSARNRKTYRYGSTLLAFTHGDEEPKRDLPAIVMAENRNELAGVEHIEIHGGHFHKRGKIEFESVDTLRGDVVYRTLPSLSGRDGWHAKKGYGTMQSAEGYLWGQEGYIGHFAV